MTNQNPNVSRAGGIMMASLFLSRVLGIVRDIVAAGMFGQNKFTDAYRISFQVPDLLFFLVAGGALSSAFIPVFSEYLHSDREDEAWSVFSSVATIMTIALVVIIGLAWIFAPQLATVICGDKREVVAEVTLMSRIVLPAQFAFFIGGLMMGTLYAKQIFTVPGLGPNVYNIAIILGALTLGHVLYPGVMGMSWGALVGALIGNIIIPMVAIKHIGVRFKPSLDFSHPGVRKVFKLMLPVILGLSLPGVYALILQYFCTFYPEGSNTAVDTANRLMQAPLAIFGQSLALAAFPALSQFWTQNRKDAFGLQLTKSLQTVVYLTLPVSALLVALPHSIVKALFEHGRFTTENTTSTASVLQMFAFGVAAWCLHPLLMRAYFAMQKNVRPIVMGTVATLIYCGLCLLIVAYHKPVSWFGIAGSISATLLVFFMVKDLKKDVDGLDISALLGSILRSTLAAVMTGLIAFAGSQAIEILVKPKPIFIICVALLGLCCVWAYYFMAKWLGSTEGQYLERAAQKLTGQQKGSERE